MALTQVETSGLSGSGASSNSTTGNVFSQTGPFKNRIINGDMRIDQRNAGAGVTINTTANTFTLDRWAAYGQSADGVFTIQQSTSSPPAGFSHFLRATTTTADSSIGATQSYGLRYVIEGNNISDFAFGSASAKQITLSFWVRSSLTGTFGGSILNNAGNRCYVFSFSIGATNTWEQKTITITGDTTGTWETGTSAGIAMFISFGAGSTYSGTAGSWGSTNYYGVTGGVNLIGTLNATLDITGVQLEVGTSATQFERRSYGQELALCQRYFYLVRDTGSGDTRYAVGLQYSTTQGLALLQFPVTMRTSVSALTTSGTAGDYGFLDAGVTRTLTSVPALNTASSNSCEISGAVSGATLTGGRACIFRSNSANSFLGFSAEL